MTYSRVVAFGEAMIRLTTEVGIPLEAATSLGILVGGAELNAAIAARRSGMEASWVSTLPKGPLGEIVMRHVRANGVTPMVRREDDTRLGLYFLEKTAPPRASRIIYDRGHSAFALHPDPSERWEDLLDADACLLISGITPALGPGPRDAIARALAAAEEVGATVALDINLRPSLWDPAEALAWVGSVMDHVDILAAGGTDLERLGVNSDDPHQAAVSKLGLKAAIGTTKHIEGQTIHLRTHGATADTTHTIELSASVIDPVGGGDAMFGTFLAGLDRLSLSEAVERAAQAAVVSYGIAGDALTVDPTVTDRNGGVER